MAVQPSLVSIVMAALLSHPSGLNSCSTEYDVAAVVMQISLLSHVMLE